MALPQVKLGLASVSKMIIGGNPFSGFSHQGLDRDSEMRAYYTPGRIRETLAKAESLGVNTFIGRADANVVGLLAEYWSQGGGIQWIAQTCPELGTTPPVVSGGLDGGATATFVHGGNTDYLLAQGKLDILGDVVANVRATGLPIGIAGHNPDVFRWAEANIDVDFYMCSYYNPTPRDADANHPAGADEIFDDADRAAMVEVIATLSRPVIHYKVLAAGRHHPADALGFVADHLRPQDAVCIGYYLKDHPDQIEQNLALLNLI